MGQQLGVAGHPRHGGTAAIRALALRVTVDIDSEGFVVRRAVGSLGGLSAFPKARPHCSRASRRRTPTPTCSPIQRTASSASKVAHAHYVPDRRTSSGSTSSPPGQRDRGPAKHRPALVAEQVSTTNTTADTNYGLVICCTRYEHEHSRSVYGRGALPIGNLVTSRLSYAANLLHTLAWRFPGAPRHSGMETASVACLPRTVGSGLSPCSSCCPCWDKFGRPKDAVAIFEYLT